MGFRHLHVAAYCLTLALFLSACNPAPGPPLRIGTNVWAGYEPLYLARSLGYYEGSRIKLVELTSASEVIHALRSGSLEGAALTLDEVLNLVDEGLDLKVILVMDFSDGADVLLAKPGIDSLADLRDKRVAVEYAAVGAILLDSALDAAGLTASDIEIVACTVDEHLECFPSVDAIVTFEPVKTKLLRQGARLLFDSSQIPGRIMDVLVVLAATTKTHSHSLELLLDGYFRARKYLDAHPEDALKRIALRQGLSSATVLSAYDGLTLPGLEENQALLEGNPAPLQRSADKLAGYMLEKKLLRHPLKVDDLTDGHFLPGVTP